MEKRESEKSGNLLHLVVFGSSVGLLIATGNPAFIVTALAALAAYRDSRNKQAQ